jgi:hypothetical protein
MRHIPKPPAMRRLGPVRPSRTSGWSAAPLSRRLGRARLAPLRGCSAPSGPCRAVSPAGAGAPRPTAAARCSRRQPAAGRGGADLRQGVEVSGHCGTSTRGTGTHAVTPTPYPASWPVAGQPKAMIPASTGHRTKPAHRRDRERRQQPDQHLAGTDACGGDRHAGRGGPAPERGINSGHPEPAGRNANIM